MSLIPPAPASNRHDFFAIGLDQEVPPLRRTADGGIDYDFYLRRSRQIRGAAWALALRRLGSGLAKAWSRLITRLREARAHRRAVNELLAMDDRSLRDLGVNRAGLSYIVDHGREDAPAPANANVRAPASTKVA